MTRGSSFDDPANTSYSASYHSHLSSADSTAQLNINTNNTTSSQSHSDHTPGQQQRTPSARLVSSLGNDASTQSPEQNRQFFRDGGELTPPSLPFAYSQSARPPSLNSDTRSAKTTSLSINYVPTKFAKLHETGVWQHRDRKQGGGREAFADNAGRMGEGEETTFQVGKGRKKAKLRWNRFKWALFVTNSASFLYGMAGLVAALLVWFNIFYRSDVLRVANRTELILSTTAAALTVFTSLIGFAGILLNNRPFLAVYTILLWVCLALIVAPGYLTYKQRTFNLEGKINAQWSRDLGLTGRLRIQNALTCCGYFSPFVEATSSNLCYARSNLPGCKGHYLRFERNVLQYWYIASFSLVPVQIAVIITSLLSSSQITYRFGKGLTPKRYRLDLNAMNVLMEEYSSQIAGMYGPDAAQEALARSSSHLCLDEKNGYLQPDQQSSHGLSTGVGNLSYATHRPAAGYRERLSSFN